MSSAATKRDDESAAKPWEQLGSTREPSYSFFYLAAEITSCDGSHWPIKVPVCISFTLLAVLTNYFFPLSVLVMDPEDWKYVQILKLPDNIMWTKLYEF